MIGYYVHHVGHGHLHRACQLAAELELRGESVTGLSSLPRPEGWAGDWELLPRDDLPARADAPDARGRLHWAPVDHDGLRRRMAQISSWIGRAAPAAVVTDVSVEVAVLTRLHGVRVVGVVVPGRRPDPAHRLGFDVADLLVGFWPPAAQRMLPGAPHDVTARLHAVGALSRFAPATGTHRSSSTPPTALLLLGSGGHSMSAAGIAAMKAETPDWRWTVLGGSAGPWVADPWAAIREADVVVTHAGQNALAEVAAARRPAVVVPQPRPHDEQAVAAAALAHGSWPAVVVDGWPARGWPALLDGAAALDGDGWADWCDGLAAQRFADLVLEVVPDVRRPGSTHRAAVARDHAAGTPPASPPSARNPSAR